jgi:hypothetical protein
VPPLFLCFSVFLGAGERRGRGSDGSGNGERRGRGSDGSGNGERRGRGSDGSGNGERRGRDSDGSGNGERRGRGSDGSGKPLKAQVLVSPLFVVHVLTGDLSPFFDKRGTPQIRDLERLLKRGSLPPAQQARKQAQVTTRLLSPPSISGCPCTCGSVWAAPSVMTLVNAWLLTSGCHSPLPRGPRPYGGPG